MGYRIKRCVIAVASASGLCAAAAAQAGELIGGLAAHDVNIGVATATHEGGTDLHLGYRSDRLAALKAVGAPQAHAYLSLNSRHRTNFVAAGLSWKVWLDQAQSLYVRPGIGLAAHDGYVDLPPEEAGLSNAEILRRVEIYRTRKPYGARFLFEPSLALGWQASRQLAVEAVYTHLSHAKLGGEDNPGVDILGVRFAYRFNP